MGGSKSPWINGGKDNGNYVSSTGSFLVVRQGGKEYCAKKTDWKYTKNKWHTFRIVTKINGAITIYIDGKVHINLTLPAKYNLPVGTFGIFVAWSQIEFKNVQYKDTVPAQLPQ